MFGVLSTVLLIVTLALGSTGAAVMAAQSSLPDQPLYPVKTWSESVRSGLTSGEQPRLNLALELANRRAGEMQAMLKAGQVPPQAVITRWQAQLNHALQIAAGRPDEDVPPALQQIRTRLREQEQAFLQLGAPGDPQVRAVLEQVQATLHDRLSLCEQGLEDPDALRQHIRDRDRDGSWDRKAGPTLRPTQSRTAGPRATGTPEPGSGNGPGPGEGQNPWTDETPTPGSGYGPGPGDGGSEPGGGEPGGGSPWVDDTPTPGSGYGPGPGDGGDEPGGGEPGGGDMPGEGVPDPEGGGSGPGPGSGDGAGSGDGGGAPGGETPGDGTPDGRDAGHGTGNEEAGSAGDPGGSGEGGGTGKGH